MMGGVFQRWRLFKCKACHIWTHAFNEIRKQVRSPTFNNQVHQKEAFSALSGLLSNKEEVPGAEARSVKVPILKQLKL